MLKRQRERVLELARRHGAVNVRVFGSVAREEDTEGSDIDLLVDLEPGHTILDLVGLRRELTEALGISVDVTTVRMLKKQLRPRVLAEAVPPVSRSRSSREDAVRLAGILAAMERVDRYRAGLEDGGDGDTELVRDAILCNLVAIGEAVNALSDDVTAKAPQIPWRDVVGLRNFLAHEYFDIDPELIAQVINVELHELRDVVISLLRELRG